MKGRGKGAGCGAGVRSDRRGGKGRMGGAVVRAVGNRRLDSGRRARSRLCAGAGLSGGRREDAGTRLCDAGDDVTLSGVFVRFDQVYEKAIHRSMRKPSTGP